MVTSLGNIGLRQFTPNLTPIETGRMNSYEDLRKTKLRESAIRKGFLKSYEELCRLSCCSPHNEVT